MMNNERREFLKQSLSVAAGITIVGFAAPILQGCADSSSSDPDTGKTITVNVGTLDTIGRAVRSETPSGRPIIIIRTGDTAYTTLLLVCTHEGCKGSQISYASTILTCTCHGSKFTALGAVVNGPATKPLSTFSTTYNDSDKTVTIVL